MRGHAPTHLYNNVFYKINSSDKFIQKFTLLTTSPVFLVQGGSPHIHTHTSISEWYMF